MRPPLTKPGDMWSKEWSTGFVVRIVLTSTEACTSGNCLSIWNLSVFKKFMDLDVYYTSYLKNYEVIDAIE